MNRYLIVLVIAMLSSFEALADWDPALEAQEQAERDAAMRVEQAKQREVEKIQSEATAKMNKQLMDSKRKTLGAAANGKSDAEINRLYDAKIQDTTANAYQEAAKAREALSHGEGAAALRQTTGKTLHELENMTDEEAEALGREMEKKYGQ